MQKVEQQHGQVLVSFMDVRSAQKALTSARLELDGHPLQLLHVEEG